MLVVPGRPAKQGLIWWVLTDDGRAPRLEILGPGGAGAIVAVCPLDPVHLPGAFLVGTTGLREDSEYTLRASSPGGGTPAAARARTLPDPLRPGQKLTIALGSCFSVAQDKGVLAAAYPPDRYGPGREPIHLRMLTGDQVYMDLDPASGSPVVFSAPKVWERYVSQWRAPQFSQFISASPNLMMADDHEFWNDYPHGNVWLPWARLDNAAVADFDPAFSVFQAALNVDPAKVSELAANPVALREFLAQQARTFELPTSPVSIFFLDTRTRRTRFDDARPRIALEAWLGEAVRWLGSLATPGVLVVSQPLVERPAGWFARATHTMGDVNFPDYREDFATLWKAVLDARHDVLVVSGDIHWNRLYRVSTGARPDHSVYELIASPLARIKQGGDVKDVQDKAGKVEWTDGSASWSRLFAENATTSYITVTFTAATPVAVEVALWGQRSSTTAASTPVAQATLKLV
jgi:hypothetical protein